MVQGLVVNTIARMATEFDESLTDDEFQARIDDLLSSALEDQAREQRFLLDMVQGARAALGKAEEQMTALRNLVEERDKGVVDILEARLSGVGSQESIDRLASEVSELAASTARNPIEHLVEPLDQRFAELATKVSAIEAALKPLDPWKPAIEMQKNLSDRFQQRLEPIGDQLQLLGRLIEQIPVPLQRAIEDATRASGDLSTNHMLEIAKTIEGFSSAITRAVDALNDSFLAARQQTTHEMESITSSIMARLAEIEEAVAGDVDVAQDGLSEAIETSNRDLSERLVSTIGTATASSVETISDAIARSGEQQMVATDSAVRAALADLRELIRTSREISDERLDEVSDRIERAAAETAGDLSERVGGIRLGLTEMRETLVGTMGQALQEFNDRQAETADKTVSSVAELASEIRDQQTAATEQTVSSMNEMLQTASARLFDRMHAIRTDVERMEKAVVELPEAVGTVVDEAAKAVLPFTEELRVLSERVRQSNRRITESNARVEAMNDSIVGYLAQRDEKLERVRDAVLNDLILHLATDLKTRDKGRLAEALRDSEQRRRDRRDAERWRKLDAEGASASHERITEVREQLQAVHTSSILRTTEAARVREEVPPPAKVDPPEPVEPSADRQTETTSTSRTPKRASKPKPVEAAGVAKTATRKPVDKSKAQTTKTSAGKKDSQLASVSKIGSRQTAPKTSRPTASTSKAARKTRAKGTV